MQIKVEKLSQVKKKIHFEIPAARVATEIDKAYEKIRRNAAIKGFRKGKVPFALIEKHYSPQMESDVVKNLVNETYFKALLDEKIYPVSHPLIESDELKKGEPFTYSATVEVFPEVTVKDFAGLEVKKEQYLFKDEVIDARLQEMRESMAQMQPVDDRAAVMGDFVTLDFVGSFDGVPFENGSAEDFVLEIGSGRFIPGFEEQVVGLGAGKQKEIKVTFPQDYGHAEFAGKEATFAVTVKEIKAKELPPLDDELAKEFGEFETLGELRAKLTEYHEKREKERIDTELRERLVKALIERNTIEVPETLVEKQLESMLESTKRRLSQQRLSLEMMGLDEEQYRIKYREAAQTQVEGALLLEGLAKQEGLTVTDADLEARFAQIAEQSGQAVESVKNYYTQNEHARENITAQVREDKAIDYLLERAVVSEVSREEL
jgi:trigger factor